MDRRIKKITILVILVSVLMVAVIGHTNVTYAVGPT